MRFALFVAALATLFSPLAHAQDAYQAALRGGNEVPPVATDAYGVAKVFIDGTTITVSGSFTGLSSAYVASHIHRGPRGENGPVVLTLTAGLSADRTEGSWAFGDNTFTVTQALADSIAGGLAYVNVHTTANPGGEIRGPIVTSARTADVVITGVFDGDRPGGLPKAVEIYAIGDIADLSRYGLGTANNGDGTDGAEFIFPERAVPSGTFVTVTTDAQAFEDYFGVVADYVDGAVAINGDDAVELFYDADDDDDYARAEVVDTFGEVSVSGTGQAWDYTDGWAYRKSGTDATGDIFVPTLWTYSGANANEGAATNAAAAAPFPLGTYAPVVANPTARVQIIHNSPDPAADTVDVYVNGERLLDDVAFRTATPFLDVPAGVELSIDITPGDALDNAAPAFSATYELAASSSVQLVATGVLGTGFAANPDGRDTAFTLLEVPRAQEAASDAATVDVRVIHGAPDAPTVDVRLLDASLAPIDGAVLVDDAAYTDATTYLALDPAAYVLGITTADGATVVAASAADLSDAAGAAVTVLASGFLTPADDRDGPAFELLLVRADGTAGVLPVATSNEETARAAGMDLRVANPLARSTAITFDAGRAGRVELALFDALGRRVRQLVDATVVPGARTAQLDVRSLAPGVYVLRLAGEAGTLARTVTVVR